MTHAEKCPVCGGTGKIPRQGLRGHYEPNGETTPMNTCHACHGKGWVAVPGSKESD
jgi:DnaJ-class molecular chaperone